MTAIAPNSTAVTETPQPIAPAPGLTPDQRRIKALARFATSISVLTIVGHLVLGFEPSWLQLIVTAGTAYSLDLVLETVDAWGHKRAPRYLGGVKNFVVFLLPAHIAAFSLSLLIYPGQNLWIAVLAGALAIGSKYVFQAPVNGRMRHFMNPSNVAIAIVLTVYSWVGPAPSYMFTENISGVWDAVVPLILLGFGSMLNIKLTRRGPLIAAWVGGFAAQAIIRGLVAGDEFSMISGLAVMTGATFVLFTNFMITDPGTTPFSVRGQIVFGLTAAALYGILAANGITYGLFYCVVGACLLRGALLWGLHARRLWGSPPAVAVAR